MIEPVYDHCTWMKDHVRPSQKSNDYRAISVFWEIGGVKAYCLIDSSCEGVMIAPEFTTSVKIKTFALKKAKTNWKTIGCNRKQICYKLWY